MNFSYILSVIVFVINLANCEHLPSFITACSASDPDLNNCIEGVARTALKRFSNGIPESNVPKLDPAKLGKIVINVPGLKIIFSNTTLTGLGDGRLEKFRLNVEKRVLKMQYIGNVTMKGQYTMNGRIIILPVVGDGDYTNFITNMRLKITYKFDLVTLDDGKDHWVMEVSKRTYTVERARFDLQNLFGGNRILGDTTLAFLNDNWESIMKDIAPPAVDQIMDVCLKVVNKFYASVPANELLLP